MNVAAGRAGNGDLVVIASGWSLKGRFSAGRGPLAGRGTSSVGFGVRRTADAPGVSTNEAFPQAEPGMTQFVPFGDVLVATDHSLRVSAYAQSQDHSTNKVSMLRSDDDGATWQPMAVISDGRNETAFCGGHNETGAASGRASYVDCCRSAVESRTGS